MNTIFDRIKDENCWPINQDYCNSKCKECDNPFLGPKRAPQCWSCTSEERKSEWFQWNNMEYQGGE